MRRRPRRFSPPRCATPCFRAAPASAPRLTLAVAAACGDDHPEASDAAACAIEVFALRLAGAWTICPASINAATRRGKTLGPRRLRRAARGLGRRRADRARFSRTSPGGAIATPARLGPSRHHHRPGGGNAVRHRRRPRPGRASPSPTCPSTSGPKPAHSSRRRRSPARSPPAPTRNAGGLWVNASAKPTRSPTTCSTRSRPRKTATSLSARILALGRPSAVAAYGIDGALSLLESLAPRSRRINPRLRWGRAAARADRAGSKAFWCRRVCTASQLKESALLLKTARRGERKQKLLYTGRAPRPWM